MASHFCNLLTFYQIDGGDRAGYNCINCGVINGREASRPEDHGLRCNVAAALARLAKEKSARRRTHERSNGD